MDDFTGQCACGAVAYAFSGEYYGIVNCHCKLCQQLHGNYNPMLVTDKTNFSFTNDEGITWYQTSEEKDRGFCKVCGSAMFMRQLKGPKILISVGSLDDTEGLDNVKNVFTEEAGTYYVTPSEDE